MDLDYINLNKRLKKAFYRVKKDISDIKIENEQLKAKVKHFVSDSETNRVLKDVLNSNKDNSDNKDFKESSTGNQGVGHTDNNLRTTHGQTADNPRTDIKQNWVLDTNKDINILKKEITNRFKRLSSQQFKVFNTIYTLEEELNQAITYKDLAIKLKLSQSAIRGHITELLLKRIPLTKEKSGNNIIYISIPRDFRSLTLFEKLLKLHDFDPSQKTLFE